MSQCYAQHMSQCYAQHRPTRLAARTGQNRFVHVTAHAPVRTADLGGWTDTWFAASGTVCNVAVEPGITVDLVLSKRSAPNPRVRIVNGSLVQEYRYTPDEVPGSVDPLIAAAVRCVAPPGDVEIRIESGVPAGSGLGTSASLAVALLAGLHALHGVSLDRAELARRAHSVETSLGLQSGVQDQLGAAFGGVHLFDIAYPGLGSPPLRVADQLAAHLGSSLVTVYLGHPHRSSEIHEQVIASLEEGDNDAKLQPLRAAALEGFAAVCAGDLEAYGLAMRSNHAAQEALHPALVSELANRTIRVAEASGARGWKVNGAGGDGGSLCLLGPSDPTEREEMIRAVAAVGGVRVLDLRVAFSGVEVVIG